MTGSFERSTAGSRRGRAIRRFVTAGASDALGAVTGIPTSLLAEVAGLARPLLPRWMVSTTFLDDRSRNWESWYHHDASRPTLSIPFAGRDYSLPYQVLLPPGLPQLRIEYDAKLFHLDPEIRAFTEPCLVLQKRRARWLHLKMSNEDNLRLRAVRYAPAPTLVLERVKYHDALRTNFSMDFHPGRGTQSLRELVHPDKRLSPDGNSRLADHLGISVLLFTADGQLMLSRRARWVAVFPGQLAPSSSGAMSIQDASHGESLFRHHTWLRETLEERGLDIGEVVQATFLGLVREFVRGGKPELFFLVETNLSQQHLLTRLADARDKHEWKGRHLFLPFEGFPRQHTAHGVQVHNFLLKLDSFLSRHAHTASWPLLAALGLWAGMLTDTRDAT